MVGGALIILLQPLKPPPLVNPPAYVVSGPASSGDVLSWGIQIDRNRTDADIVLLSVEPVSPSGLEIVGEGSYDPYPSGIGLVEGYPPQGFDFAAVEGTVIPPREYRHVVFGVRLASGADRGSICGVRVAYVHERRRYDLILDFQLHLLPPDETQSPAPSVDSGACPSS